MSERPKERASKAREGQPSAGSNPAATASLTRPNARPAGSLAPAFLAVASNVSQLVSIGASLLDHSDYWRPTYTTRSSTELVRAASRTSRVLIASVAGTGCGALPRAAAANWA